MCVVGSFRWQYVLHDLGAMCVVESLRWQCVFLGLLGGKMSWLVF